MSRLESGIEINLECEVCHDLKIRLGKLIKWLIFFLNLKRVLSLMKFC